MSTTIGNLAVILSANTAGFTAGFAAASKGVTSFTGMLGSMAKSAGAIVGIGSIAGMIGKSFSGFTKAEENRVTFEALLGSGERAKQLMKEISGVAYKSPFASEFAGAAKELLKFGFAQESIAPTLNMLGDVAAGTGANMGELAQLIGQSGYRASISKRQLAGLAEAGVPVLQELSSTLGLTKDSVLQLAEQGGVKFEDLMGVLRKVTGEGGNFHGMMEKRGNTTLGIWTRIEEGVGGTIGKFGSVFGDSLAKAVGFKEGMGGIADFVEGLRTGVGDLQPAIDLVILGFQAVGDIGVAAWEGVSLAFQAGWAVISGVFESFGEVLSGFRNTFIEGCLAVRFVFQNFGEVMAYEFELIKLRLYAFGANAVHLFTVNIPEILGWFSRNWRDVFTDMYSYTITVFENIGKNIWEFIKNIPGLIAGTTSFSDIWTPLGEGFKSTITEALQVTKRDLTDWEKEMANKAEGMRNKLAEKWTDFSSKEKTRFDPTVDSSLLAGILGGVVGGGIKQAKAPFEGTGTLPEKIKDANKYAGAFEVGSKGAYDLILKSRDVNLAPANRTAKASENTAKNTEKIVDLSQTIADSIVDLPSIQMGGI